MNKKNNFSRILTTGSPKQRALLITEDVARSKYSIKGALKESEFNALINSFTTDKELKIYNRFGDLDKRITFIIDQLALLSMIYRERLSALKGFILLWDSHKRSEEAVNFILHQLEPDDRKRVTREALKKFNNQDHVFLFARTKADKEGYFEVGYSGKDENLLNAIEDLRAEAITEATKLLSYAQATLDYMRDEGFRVKTYEKIINELIKDAHSLGSQMIPKYTPLGWEELIGQDERLKKLYQIYPDFSEIEIDQALYDEFLEDKVKL